MIHLASASDIQYLMGTDAEEVRRSSALFLLKLKELRRTSQIAIDEVVESSRRLFLQTMERAQAGVRAKLAESGVDPITIKGLDEAFSDAADPFEAIETSHLQEKYLREKLDLIVSSQDMYYSIHNYCRTVRQWQGDNSEFTQLHGLRHFRVDNCSAI